MISKYFNDCHIASELYTESGWFYDYREHDKNVSLNNKYMEAINNNVDYRVNDKIVWSPGEPLPRFPLPIHSLANFAHGLAPHAKIDFALWELEDTVDLININSLCYVVDTATPFFQKYLNIKNIDFSKVEFATYAFSGIQFDGTEEDFYEFFKFPSLAYGYGMFSGFTGVGGTTLDFIFDINRVCTTKLQNMGSFLSFSKFKEVNLLSTGENFRPTRVDSMISHTDYAVDGLMQFDYSRLATWSRGCFLNPNWTKEKRAEFIKLCRHVPADNANSMYSGIKDLSYSDVEGVTYNLYSALFMFEGAHFTSDNILQNVIINIKGDTLNAQDMFTGITSDTGSLILPDVRAVTDGIRMFANIAAHTDGTPFKLIFARNESPLESLSGRYQLFSGSVVWIPDSNNSSGLGNPFNSPVMQDRGFEDMLNGAKIFSGESIPSPVICAANFNYEAPSSIIDPYDNMWKVSTDGGYNLRVRWATTADADTARATMNPPSNVSFTGL